jgi:hypothetical protein
LEKKLTELMQKKERREQTLGVEKNRERKEGICKNRKERDGRKAVIIN